MSVLLQELVRFDRVALETVQALRWSPLTPAFLLLSAWWVKGPLLVGFGACADLRERRRLIVPAALGATLAVLVGALTSTAIKELVDRVRPPFADFGVTALGDAPNTPSFPSGHATTTFAAAAVVGAFYPRLRLPVYGLAALVGVSRMYLGVHYTLDVVAGAVLGTAIGLGVAWAIRRFSHRTG